ncbi:MAG: hypothetical protein RIQ51_1234 [Bacteroidota bacterium]|jgi:hypothetical protein
MTKKDKLLERFLSMPKDFSYQELKTLLSGLGYEEHHLGKTSGSRVLFFNDKIGHEIKIHKPHPGNIIKPYLMKYIYENLKERIL